MIAALPTAAAAAADPGEPPRAPASARPQAFAMIVDALSGDGAAAGATPAGADETPAAPDTTPVEAPDAVPAIAAPVTDAAALIAQLCPPSVAAGPSAPPPETADRAPATTERAPVAQAPVGPAARMAGKARAPSRDRKDGSAAIDTAPATPAAPAATTVKAADAPSPVTDKAEIATAPAENAIRHHLDLAHDEQWLDRLAQDIARSADGDSRLRFALAPEHLGRLTVELAAGADGTQIRMTTESEQAHRIIADAQPRLIAEARAQGLRVSDTQVALDNRFSGQQQQQQPGGQAPRDQPRSRATSTAAIDRSVPAARDLYA